MAIAVMDADYTMVGGTEPTLLEWETLRNHPLLSPGVAKAKWAERHLITLHRNIQDTFALPSNKSMLRADFDAESGYHIFKITKLPDIAVLYEHFTMTVADVVGNLRAALDKFAWQLAVDLAGGNPPDPFGVRFPIADCLSGCERAFNNEKRLKRQIDARHWDFIESFQPYHGTDGRADNYTGPYIHQLTLLRDFSNDDKHRLTEPILLVPYQFQLPQLPTVNRYVEGLPVPVLDFEVHDPGTHLELDVEVLRMRLAPGSPPHIDQAGEFTPHVSMSEGRHAVSTLNRITRYVQLIFSEFTRRFPSRP